MARRVLDIARVRATMVSMATVVVAACAGAPGDDAARPSANDGMFRDFVDGKFDGAGHPINARVIEAAALCDDAGEATDDGLALTRACEGQVPGAAQRGELVVNARVKVMEMGEGEVVTVMVKGEGAEVKETIAADRVRAVGEWIDVPVRYWSDGQARTIAIEPAAGASIELAYVETFPPRFRMALSPGSGVIADDDVVTIEMARGDAIERVELDGVDVTEQWRALDEAGLVTRTETEFRALYGVRAGDLAPARGDVAQVRVRGGGEVARMELRRAPAPCAYEGDANGTPVLVTGFQPFPADGWHENVAEVAVRNLRPSALHGVRVMRLVLPVEYDRAAAAVRDAITRCAPRAVVSFGQGGGSIALEQTAYNLKDTGEVAGGVPDNRGVIAAALPIDPSAPAERASSLPLAAIERSLRAIGESPVRSDDPGRYICNNVFFTSTGASSRAGFVHLPYTTQFDEAERARWGHVAETIVQTLR
jgi:pyroglutamyl-peptidase